MRILLLVDGPNWANDRIAQAIKLYGEEPLYKFDILYHNKYQDTEDEKKILNAADVIHCFSYKAWDMLDDKLLLGKKLISVIASRKSFNKQWKNSRWFDISHNVIITSPGLKDLFGDKVPEKVIYVPNGVDMNLFKIGNCERKYVGHVACHKPWKGFDEFIAPAAKLASLKTIRPNLNKKAASNALPHNELINLYHQMLVYVCASTKEEGFGLPIVEALACGIPVISTKVGIAPEIIRNGVNGYLVDRDVAQIASSIPLTNNNCDINACRKSVKPYRWENVVCQLKNLYKS